ncbi:MAG: hypothetical protein ACLPX7_18485 [Xanthobacteraceae bacterium]
MKPTISLSDALADSRLMGNTFKASSFWTWKVVAKLIDGLPLTERREIELFKRCTGRAYNRRAHRAIRRLIILVGRRGGKDRFLSAVAVWRAALCTDWKQHISAGEQAVVILLGADRRQSAILRRYCQGLLSAPLLAAEVTRMTDEVIEFRNCSSLEIGTNDARLIRGRSAIAVLGSECCHWRTDEHSASSDEEVVGAAEPSMAMCPDGGLLLLGSSVHRRVGYMYRQFKRLHGNDDAEDICWFAPSSVMNPKLPQPVIARAIADDAPKARAEYENVWREDLSSYITPGLIESSVDEGVTVRPYDPRHQYQSFIDASSGTSDAFACAIAHREGDVAILDCLVEILAPFNTTEATAQIAEVLKGYGCRSTMGDDHAKGWVRSELARHGVTLESRPSGMDGSVFHLEALPLFGSGRARLLANARLVGQYCALERRPRGEREWVGHPNRAHDDLAIVCSGALWRASRSAGSLWRAEHFLINGRAVELPPKYVLALYVTLVGSASGQLAVAYFQEYRRNGRIMLHLADIDVKALAPATMHDVQARISELYRESEQSIIGHKVFAQAAVSDHLDKVLGRAIGAERIDSLLASNSLALSASLHIGAGAVSVAGAVWQKPFGLSFLDGVSGHDDDILRLAVLSGIVAVRDGIALPRVVL